MKRILFLCSMLVAASLSGGLLQAQSVEELKAAAMLYDMDSCTFSSSIVTVDGFRYKLDATKHLARFVYFNKTDVAPETLVIPETITYNDAVYVVVATEGYYSYLQNNFVGIANSDYSSIWQLKTAKLQIIGNQEILL